MCGQDFRVRSELESICEGLTAMCWTWQDQHNNVARFLEGRGLVSEALYIATDPDYRFELAVQLGELDLALSIAGESGTEHKWRQLGELALSAGKLEVSTLHPICQCVCGCSLQAVLQMPSGSEACPSKPPFIVPCDVLV